MKYIKNFVNKTHCNQIYSYLKNNTSKTYTLDNTRPWFENNNIFRVFIYVIVFNFFNLVYKEL